MRASNGMGRVKYRKSYSNHRRVRRRKWGKRLFILLLIAAGIVGTAYLLGFLFNNISQWNQGRTPAATEVPALIVQTPAPHERFTDKNLIGTWKGSEKVNKGKEIKFSKRFGHIFIDKDSFKGEAVKYYYVSYRDGAIEFMPYYTSDAPKTTIAPDGSDDIYLMKGQYVIEGDILQLTINGQTYKYKKNIEATPTATNESSDESSDNAEVDSEDLEDEDEADDVDEADAEEDDARESAVEPKKKPTPKPTAKPTSKPTPKPKKTPKPASDQPDNDSGNEEAPVVNNQPGEDSSNADSDTNEDVENYDPAG